MSMIFHSAMTVLILMIFLIFTYIWWKKHYTKQCLDLLKKSLLEHIMCLDNRSFIEPFTFNSKRPIKFLSLNN